MAFQSELQATSVDPAGLTQLIRNLGRDCTPDQYLREFLKNSIQACERALNQNRDDLLYQPTIHLDANPDLREAGLWKLSFVDNGDGMDRDEMVSLLNNLSASGSVKNQHINYGVGAKIAAMTRNHEGIVYESWKNGLGHRIIVKFDEDAGIYGIAPIDLPDGSFDYVIQLAPSEKPNLIDEHGTRVTLLGMSLEQDTMKKPEGVNGSNEAWFINYLNTRFFKIPENIEIKARYRYYSEDPGKTYMTPIEGQKKTLDSISILRGTLRVKGANVYWWGMPKQTGGHGRSTLKGHTALIHEDEVFDLADSRSSRANYFGILIGKERVIIYVEPDIAEQNTSRTSLVKPDGSNIIWDGWQQEFRANMPEDLKGFLEELSSEQTNESHSASIADRLRDLGNLYKLSMYRASEVGDKQGDPDSEISAGGNTRTGIETDVIDDDVVEVDRPRTVTPKRKAMNPVMARLLTKGGISSKEVNNVEFPTVKWVSERTETYLADRVASYDTASHVIVANSDFAGLRDVVKFVTRPEYKEIDGAITIVEDEVRKAFEQALVEVVTGALSFRRGRRAWKPEEFERAISPEALSSAMMIRYWIVQDVKRILGGKIKALSTPEEESH